MSNINLVKLRNLDPEVLAYIKGHMPSGSDPMPYLKQSDLAPYFNKNTDLVDELLVTDGLKDHIVNLAVNKIAASKAYRRNADAVIYNDLDPELKKKIDKINALSNFGVPQDLLDDIEKIKLAYKKADSTVTEIKGSIENLKTEDQKIKDSITTINTDLLAKIKQNTDDITNLKINPILSLTKEQIDDITNIVNNIETLNNVTNKITEVQGKINQTEIKISEVKSDSEQIKKDVAKNKNDIAEIVKDFNSAKDLGRQTLSDIENIKANVLQLKTEINNTEEDLSNTKITVGKVQTDLGLVKLNFDEISRTENAGSSIYLNQNRMLSARNNLSFLKIVYTEEDMNSTLAEKKEEVFFSMFDGSVYILEPDEDNPSEKKYVKDDPPFDAKYLGIFIYDKNTATLYYSDETGLHNVGSGKKKELIKDVEILANNEMTILIPSAFDSEIHTLILDEEEDSRTKGQYINSEAYLTTAYDENQIIVYNDADETMKVRVVYCVNAMKKTRKDIEIEPNSSQSIAVYNPYSYDIKILVLDEEEGSKTNGKYIDAELVVPMARDDNEIVVYNDAMTKLNVRVIY